MRRRVYWLLKQRVFFAYSLHLREILLSLWMSRRRELVYYAITNQTVCLRLYHQPPFMQYVPLVFPLA